MRYFEYTKLTLREQGWKIDPFPMIWTRSDNAGIVPDHNRGGRRTYETAFLCHRGDRPIVRPVALHYILRAGKHRRPFIDKARRHATSFL